MSKEINFEEIILRHISEMSPKAKELAYNTAQVGDFDEEIASDLTKAKTESIVAILGAMEEVCELAIQICSEVAKVKCELGTCSDCDNHTVDKESILAVKDLIILPIKKQE